MIAPSAIAALPTLDDWTLLPLPLTAADLRRRELSGIKFRRAHVRYLLFDHGAGRLGNLSRPDASLVRAAQRADYARYRSRCAVEARPPLGYLPYLFRWRAWQKRVWLTHDLKTRARSRLGMEAA